MPLDFNVSQTILQKSPIMGSGMRVGVWVRAVIIMQSAFLILSWSIDLGWVVRVELLDTYTIFS